jgi:type IV secretion system protein VirB6
MSVIGMVDCRVSDVAITASGTISNSIMPIVALCFSIYMILMMVNYMRGGTSSPVWDVYLRAAAFAIIIGLGLQYGNYTAYVVPMVQGIGDDLANAVSGATDGASSLDILAMHYIKILDKGYERANSNIFPFNIGPLLLFGLKFVLIAAGLVPFLVLAAALLIMAKVGAALVVAVGPIFFACLLFPATRQYFSAWVNSAFSYALIPIFVAVIAMVSVQISVEVFNPGAGGLEKMSFKYIFMASLVNLLLLVLLKVVSSLASSLSAGGINAGSPVGGEGWLRRKWLAGRGQQERLEQ